MPSVEELKKRKIVQWALAYLAGAWVVVQLLDVVAGPWGIAPGLLLAAQIVLAFGFFATLVLAWYHGEQGRQRVSGPELLMLAALLVIAGAAVAVVRGDGEATAADAGSGDGASAAETAATAAPDSIPEHSIAVLPFENQSPAEEHAYLAPALTDEITDAVTSVPELRVTSYNSAARYPGSGKTVREFALEDLGVAHVIEGSVQRLGDEVRIRVQLIDARSDEHVWSETYQKELTDVFEAQVDIARQVADKLAASFTEREMRRLQAGSTDDPVAYERYLRAFAEFQPEERAEIFRQALERDPEFGMAWFGLGRAHMRRSEEDSRWADSARRAFERAAEYTEDRLFRLWQRSIVAFYFEGDPEEAVRSIEQALAADSTFYPALEAGLQVYEGTGDLPEATRLGRRAAAVHPLSGFIWRRLGRLYRTVGLDSLAERAFHRAIDVEPVSNEPWGGLLLLRLYQGRYEQASVAADSLEARAPRTAIAWRAIIDAWSGEESRARRTLEDIYGSRESQSPWELADLLAHLRLLEGDTTKAQALLDDAEDALARLHPVHRFDVRNRHWNAMQIAAVRGDADEAASRFREYVAAGGRDVRDIEANPVFSRVLEDSAFQAELEVLEEIVERQRRRIERDLAREAVEAGAVRD